MNSYQEIKSQIDLLIEETVSSGATIDASCERACVEYWLGLLEINDFGPTYLHKFQAAIAILKNRQDFGIATDEELKQIAMYLLAKLSRDDVLTLNNESRKSLLSESTNIFLLNSPIIYSVFEI
ncbi:MAG: hypothetical protein B0W54_20530 [Cellvibrio sp. 79]|nr:MAG: hypothetical protein B0W54_20530 [Cellvibrio sp. 79]